MHAVFALGHFLLYSAYVQSTIASLGVTLSPCDTASNTVEIMETKGDSAVMCYGIANFSYAVTWYVDFAGRNGSQNVGTCKENSSTCSDFSALGYRASRPSPQTSQLNIDPQVTARTVAVNGELTCITSVGGQSTSAAKCLLDIGYPSDATCDAWYNTSGSKWTVSGSCIITKALSSRRRYECLWFYKHDNNAEVAVPSDQISNSLISKTPESNNTHPYYSFTCNFSMPFHTFAGTYYYNATVYPGTVLKYATFSGSSVIANPTDPFYNCTTDYIKEGTSLNCICNITSLGKPPAFLTWDDERGPQLHVVNVTSSMNNQLYKCEVRRGALMVKQTPYELRVAYGPRSVTVSGPSLPFDTDGTQVMTLQCIASNYSPNVTYLWRRVPNTVAANNTMFYIFKPSALDDGDKVMCTAANSAHSDIQKHSDNYTLDINYPPSTAPTIDYNNDRILYAGDNLTLVCTVSGGKPPVTRVSFTCDGLQDGTDRVGEGGITSSVNFIPLVAGDHGVNCTCGAEWKRSEMYRMTTAIRLTVHYGPVQPVVKLNMSTTGNLTVSERDLVVLTCFTHGRPIPDMTVDKTGAGRVCFVAGADLDMTERESSLNCTLANLQCHDAGTYTCTARNDVGIQAEAVTLLVNCKPRLVSVSQTPPSVNYVNQSVHLTFDMQAYPLPTITSFVYLGKSLNTSHPGMAVSDIMLDAKCRVSGQVYYVNCDVTVDNVTETSAGYYRLDLRNVHGADRFLFEVKFNDSNVPVQDKSVFPLGAAVGGGLAAAAAVVITVVAVVLFSRRQRKGSKQAKKRKTDGRTREEPGLCDETMIVNNLYGRTENTAAHESQTRTPQHSEYEDVAVPHAAKPHVQPTPPVAAKMSTANDEKDTYLIVQSKVASSPADTAEYASVDKSKTATVSRQNGRTAARTGTMPKNKSEAMQKPAQTPKPAKNKFNKKDQKEKKEGEQKLRKKPEFTEGAGNMPLSMNPIDCKVYENFGFQHEESETKLRDPLQEPADDQRNAKKDGLVYTTIQFTENQQKKAEHTPPKRETTEYVSIAFSKQPTSISGN